MMRKMMRVFAAAFGCWIGIACGPAAAEVNAFRVTPYLQHPATNAVSILWLAATNGDASVAWWEIGGARTNAIANAVRIAPEDRVANSRFTADGVLQYCLAPELSYTNSVESGDNYPAYTRETVGSNKEGAGWSLPYTVPWQYRVRLTGLAPDTTYGYRVTLEGGASYARTFRTAPVALRGIRFTCYSDSETEPADNTSTKGRTDDWTDPATGKSRLYYATQTEAYATNVARVAEFNPDLILMPGDLAQKGSRQCDWDEFWRHVAGPLNDVAGAIPIVAAPGNHDYWSYYDGGECAMRKYLSYFEFEPNGTSLDDDIQERFHRVDYGPATFLFMDANNGDDGSDGTRDTNMYLARTAADFSLYTAPSGRGCRAPDFNVGSVQYQWLEAQLKDAQKKSPFIFVVSHQCPYSVGYHGRPAGNSSDGTQDTLSGRALRNLEPLFFKYGVSAWLCGHDEMMERSEITGTVTLPDGTTRPHTIQVWDMGVAGDGLRGDIKCWNPYEKYRAGTNCVEVYDDKGVLVEGGKHYGHLEVTITNRADGAWVATFDPVYEFFTTNALGEAVFGGTRHYPDLVTLVSGAYARTEPTVDPLTYAVSNTPRAVMVTFAEGSDTRGFAWETDATVSETKLWIAERGAAAVDDALFSDATAIDGSYVDRTQSGVTVRCHKAQSGTLASGRDYAYRIGGDGCYAYGTFSVPARTVGSETCTMLYLGDAQVKYVPSFYVWENTVERAADVCAASSTDAILYGGDMFDTYASSISAYNYLKWGAAVDSATPYYPGVPWSLSRGNHDLNVANYPYYDDLTAVSYSSSSCHSFDYGPVHVCALPFVTSQNVKYYTNVAEWVEADLKAANAAGRTKWNVVMMHWGPYTTGDHGWNATTDGLVTLFCPIFARNRVDLVLQAHDHTYSKTLPYRWNAAGYTTDRTDATVVNQAPATMRIGGRSYDCNPRGTYYVATGCSGPRVWENEGAYSYPGSTHSYEQRTYKIATGRIAVDSVYGKAGDDASSELHETMFGVLKAGAETLTYDWYAVNTNGLEAAVLYDTLRVYKADPGLLFTVR